MEDFNWQLIAVAVCITAAIASTLARLKRLLAGNSGGCGDCPQAKPSTTSSDAPQLISEDQIEILYDPEE